MSISSANCREHQLLNKARIILFASIAYFWSFIDDAPINFDSVYTWPEVTNGLHHSIMEVVLHALTFFFLYLTMREAFKGIKKGEKRIFYAYTLAFIAFILAYAQNIPIDPVQDIVLKAWYPLDLAEHLLSFVVLYFAIRVASHREVIEIHAMK